MKQTIFISITLLAIFAIAFLSGYMLCCFGASSGEVSQMAIVFEKSRMQIYAVLIIVGTIACALLSFVVVREYGRK